MDIIQATGMQLDNNTLKGAQHRFPGKSGSIYEAMKAAEIENPMQLFLDNSLIIDSEYERINVKTRGVPIWITITSVNEDRILTLEKI